jgi:uncharacterized protein YjbI with pentapeptide repeats
MAREECLAKYANDRDLCCANLRDANLRFANLNRADLSGAIFKETV